MKQFLGILRYEFRMSIQRKGILLIAILFATFYIYIWLEAGANFEVTKGITDPFFAEAGQLVFGLNLFYPVVAGISSADRAVRDTRLGVRELLRGTHLKNSTYVMGKYLGVVLSYLVIEFIIVFLISSGIILIYQWPLQFILYNLLSVILISAPGLFFIIAYSLICPLFMPLRVYQILFTGYWYWGNFINPSAMFTISDTILNASGEFPMTAFLGVMVSVDSPQITQAKALANIAMLFIMAGLALAGMIALINKRERISG